MEEEQKEGLLDVNQPKELSQLKSENNPKPLEKRTSFERIIKAFQSTGGEIWFALTLIG